MASVPVFLWLFVSGRRDEGVILYGVAATTDFLDGFIARRTRSITDLGKVLDPLSDRVLIAALVVALVATGALPLWLALVVVVRDALVLAAFPLLRRRSMEPIQVNFVGKTATASLLFGLTWLALSETSFGWGRVGDEVGMVFTLLGAALYWAAAAMYAREAARRPA